MKITSYFYTQNTITKKGYEKVSIIFGDAADAGVRTDIGGMSAGCRE